MSSQSPSSEITFPQEHASDTKNIWKTFWVLSALTIIELALGYFLYFKHGELTYGFTISTKLVIVALTLAKAYYIVSIFMHLGDEVRNMILTIIVPLLLFVWFIAAFLWDGYSWRELRNTNAGTIEAPVEVHQPATK